ncbi:FAD-binding oxidoreductase [Gilliamella sp. WF3-4]|jgi:hypothetical protein|uniref:FAD-binding oxidoreductase n=1 Tax=Gilliamella sp. WF3-4 TaxID=3120255 RepID=UPI00080DA12A|nr:FAD-binding oxidoreductase [Gilliamella apicola]OCG16948.1 hypothetical protein A9G47_09850 [Gilliamella apicola]
MNNKFDITIIGNGLLGSTLAFYLSKQGYKVCIIGANYSHKNKYFSSHQDETRIVRTFHHNNEYWQDLAKESFDILKNISLENPNLFKEVPVKYLFKDGISYDNPYLIKNDSYRYNYMDTFGGILNPILYINYMNDHAINLGASLVVDDVVSINYKNETYISNGDFGEIKSEWLIDSRGIHGVTENNNNEFIIGKVAMFFKLTDTKNHSSFAFIDEITESKLINDFYGICYYKNQFGKSISKISFTETTPIVLEPNAVSNWFNGAFHEHPILNDAVTLVLSKFPNFKLADLKPCAFVKTTDGKPSVTVENKLLRINGCNGMLAKAVIAFSKNIINRYFS